MNIFKSLFNLFKANKDRDQQIRESYRNNPEVIAACKKISESFNKDIPNPRPKPKIENNRLEFKDDCIVIHAPTFSGGKAVIDALHKLKKEQASEPPSKGRLEEGKVKTNVKPPSNTPRPTIKPAPQSTHPLNYQYYRR